MAIFHRLVYDRETGKPKGYGFCEYQDTETAQSAMRNLNNHDFNGRPLRVGVAAGEQNKDEIKSMFYMIYLHVHINNYAGVEITTFNRPVHRTSAKKSTCPMNLPLVHW